MIRRDDDLARKILRESSNNPADGGYLVPVRFTRQLLWIDTPEGRLWQFRVQHWYWRLWYKVTKDPIDFV